MSVQALLGLGSTPTEWGGSLPAETDEGLLAQAAHRWDHWCTTFPVLAESGGVAGLEPWLMNNPERREPVLWALAVLGAEDGWDEIPAAAVAAWLLRHGAAYLAHRLRWVSPQIDELVAAQLWIEVRSVRWRTWRAVTSCVLWATARSVKDTVAHQAVEHPVEDPDRAGVAREQSGGVWTSQGLGDLPTADPAAEAQRLLEWAQEQGVISQRDLLLLNHVLQAVRSLGSVRQSSRQGLTSREVADIVAGQVGLCPASVRRRATGALDALAAAVPRYLDGVA